MTTRWNVQVRNAGSTDLTDQATVTFLPADEVAAQGQFPFDTLPGSHEAGGDKIFRPSEDPLLIPGDWLLVVTASGKSPVVQPIEVKGPTQSFSPATTRARAGVEATTVEISPAKPVGLIPTEFVVTFLVTLHPASEVVLLSATQYSNAGRPLREFAEARRALLYGRRIDDGSLVTIFSFDDRRRDIFVKAKPRKDRNAWLRVNTSLKAPLPADFVVTPGSPWQRREADGSLVSAKRALRSDFALSILDLYGYLNQVGTQRPRSVTEVSIFSHGWRGGPILYNTNERGSFIRAPGRDPNDFDGRIKDFNATQSAQFPNLAAAMASNSSWHIWGCQVWNRFIRVCVAAHVGANRAAADDRDLSITTGGANAQQDVTTKRDIRRMAARAFTDLSYAGALAARLAPRVSGIKVFASMPGTWSNFVGLTMQVAADSAFQAARQYFSQIEPEFASRLRFSSGLDGVRYVNYVPMRDVPVPGPRPRANHFTFEGNDFLMLYDWVFGGVGIAGPATLQRTDVRVDVANRRVLPASASGTAGLLYVMRNASVNAEQAVVVFVDGPRVAVHEVTAGVTGNLDTLGNPLPLPFGVP